MPRTDLEILPSLMGKYFRRRERTMFCPGCGYGQVIQYFLRAVDELAGKGLLDLKRLVLIGGIGCSGRIPSYLKFDVIQALHGRALAVATGIKLANPELEVVVFAGDGDTLAIGGNHLIHAARRNIGIKLVMLNNMLYANTGGQVAPTTPSGAITHTTPYGNPEQPFDGPSLMVAAGATYVARWTTAHPTQLINAFKEVLLHRGFAYLEILSQCPVYFGRYVVGLERPSQILDYFLRNTVLIDDIRAGRARPDGRIVIGKFVQTRRPTYEEVIWSQIRRAMGGDDA